MVENIEKHQTKMFLDKRYDKIKDYIIGHKETIVTSLVVAFLSYMFAFTNKLVNHDEIVALFGKGGTISSGRWGLALSSIVFPDVSMPWIYGIISIVFITASICLIIDIFSIKNKILKILLSAVIISFPSLVGILSYMFTSAPFALSFLLSVATVYFIILKDKKYIPIALILLVLSVSIYQAFIAVTASLLVLHLLQKLVSTDEDTLSVFKKAVFFFLFLGLALGIYYGITKAVLSFTGSEFSTYANDNLVQISDLPKNIFYAYLNFFAIFIGRFNLIVNPIIQAVHITAFVIFGCIFIYWICKKREIDRIVFSLLLLAVFPLSISCIYLFADISSVHSLMMYSFISVYIWMIVGAQLISLEKQLAKLFYNVFSVLFVVCIMNNIYVANNSYLQLHIAYENAYSYYSSVMTSVVNTPGFDSDCKVVLYEKGESIEQKYDFIEEFGEDSVMGIRYDLINAYSREQFVKYYLGYDVAFAADEEVKKIVQMDEFKEMQIFPYYGSVKKIDNYIVVRLSE